MDATPNRGFCWLVNSRRPTGEVARHRLCEQSDLRRGERVHLLPCPARDAGRHRALRDRRVELDLANARGVFFEAASIVGSQIARNIRVALAHRIEDALVAFAQRTQRRNRFGITRRHHREVAFKRLGCIALDRDRRFARLEGEPAIQRSRGHAVVTIAIHAEIDRTEHLAIVEVLADHVIDRCGIGARAIARSRAGEDLVDVVRVCRRKCTGGQRAGQRGLGLRGMSPRKRRASFVEHPVIEVRHEQATIAEWLERCCDIRQREPGIRRGSPCPTGNPHLIRHHDDSPRATRHRCSTRARAEASQPRQRERDASNSLDECTTA
jgi:hypothetical protein